MPRVARPSAIWITRRSCPHHSADTSRVWQKGSGHSCRRCAISCGADSGSGPARLNAAHLSKRRTIGSIHEGGRKLSGEVKTPMDDAKRYQQGWKSVGPSWETSTYVAPLPSTTDFNRDFQDFVTRNAWGEIWTRPGLPSHTRSLLTLAMMVALNRADEFSPAHSRRFQQRRDARPDQRSSAAKRDLLRRPAANSAFHIAAEVFAEMDKKPKSESKKRKRK